MADNYLEKKMAEHMAGGPRRTSRATPAGTRPGELRLGVGCLRVLVCGDSTAVADAVAATLAGAGCRVAAIGLPAAPAAVRSYPAGTGVAAVAAALVHDWHEIDLLVVAGSAPDAAEAVAAAREAIPAPLRNPAARTISIGTESGADIVLSRLDAQAGAAAIMCAAAVAAAKQLDDAGLPHVKFP